MYIYICKPELGDYGGIPFTFATEVVTICPDSSSKFDKTVELIKNIGGPLQAVEHQVSSR